MTERVFAPLEQDHPIVNSDTCAICHKKFMAGQRVMLVPIETPEMSGSLTCEARCVHATCRLYGRQTAKGIIERIKDGDGSPFPVVTTDGKQWKLEEVGLSD